MRQAKVIKMPVVSLSSAKSIQAVIAMGESNASPGILDVKRSTLSAGMLQGAPTPMQTMAQTPGLAVHELGHVRRCNT